MSSINQQAIIAELKRRREAEAAKASSFDFNKFAFKAQHAFFERKGARFKTAVCSRRAGKTVGIAAYLIYRCLNNNNISCLYITLSKRNARAIIWNDLNKICADYDLNVKINNVNMSIEFTDTASYINIEGAKDRNEIEKYRGRKLDTVAIDECQSFRPYIKELVNDIITPALRDLRGYLYLTGTPGPIPAGYFYECAHSDTWDNHFWTAFDNPHMHRPPELDLEETLAEERELKGITELDPSYRRETFGEWIEDTEALVFRYDDSTNNYNVLPKSDYIYIMGVDVGFYDADAIAVLAYSEEHDKVYLVEEFVRAKQDIGSLCEAILEIDQAYNCVKKVIDAGALGKKIQEEIINRYGITMEAAEKRRKLEFIELLNADLRKGVVKAKSTSRFAEDTKLVQWDKDKSTPDRLKVSSIYHSDICDAVLYAYREARHYMYEAPPSKPVKDTDEYMKALEEKEAEEMEMKKNKSWMELDEEDVQEYERLMNQDW